MKRKLKRKVKLIYLNLFEYYNKIYLKLCLNKKNKDLSCDKKLCSKLSGERIVILAPHVDDETIGCGGAMIKYLEEHKEIFIVYLTNGAKQGSSKNKNDVKLERMKEAMNIADALKINQNHLYFLDGEDGDLLNSHIVDELHEILKTIEPDTIFIPGLLDTHIDHYAVTDILYKIYQKNPEWFKDLNLFLYESQSPTTTSYANVCLDISKEIEFKKSLFKIFKSQPSDFLFSISLSNLNGVSLGQNVFCENYIKTSFVKYFNFYKKNFQSVDDYLTIKSKLIPHGDSSTLVKSYNSSLENKKIYNKYFNDME